MNVQYICLCQALLLLSTVGTWRMIARNEKKAVPTDDNCNGSKLYHYSTC